MPHYRPSSINTDPTRTPYRHQGACLHTSANTASHRMAPSYQRCLTLHGTIVPTLPHTTWHCHTNTASHHMAPSYQHCLTWYGTIIPNLPHTIWNHHTNTASHCMALSYQHCLTPHGTVVPILPHTAWHHHTNTVSHRMAPSYQHFTPHGTLGPTLCTLPQFQRETREGHSIL